jgi:ABC transport system ATP-binding/permease protein
VIDADISKLDQEMTKAENDYAKLAEIQKAKEAKVSKQEQYYAEWDRLEIVLSTVGALRAK